MKNNQRQIFRADALKNYAQAKDRLVLPKFISPPVFICAWALIVILLAGAILMLRVRTPVYATGSAFTLSEAEGQPPQEEGGLRIVALFPAESLPRLEAGQKLILKSDDSGQTLSARVVAAEREASSPDAVRRRFNLNACAKGLDKGSAAVVVFAELKPPRAGGVAAYGKEGGTFRAEVEIGSRRVAAFLPFIGRYLGD